ncbi:MAG: glycoside hydrolase family 2 TIM barrel-domain containing protein, partial [Planctomycetota bacterium]
FELKGAGGHARFRELAEAGGNTVRLWGVGDGTERTLDAAHAAGLKVVVGLWLGHERHGFDYGDAGAVREQFEKTKADVLRFKDHPAVLMWGVGNEMEGFGNGDNPDVWRAVNDVAEMIHEVDGKHPTMTVTAEIGGERIASINRWCPAINLHGINSYGGVHSIPQRYREAGGVKPYLVTEFGPPGVWEQADNDWGVPVEKTSTQKAEVYRSAYAALAADPLCLGSFAFLWGHKQEATATWFGMFLPDGTKLGAVDAMTRAWSGSPPANRAPVVEPMEVVGAAVVRPGAEVEVTLAASDPDGDPLRTEWVLLAEDEDRITGGDYRPTPPAFPKAIVASATDRARLTMPERGGNYRLYAYVRDGQGNGATANVPLRVDGDASAETRGAATALPLVVYGDDAQGSPYVPSGYMGSAQAISIDENDRTRPRSGATAMKVTFGAPGGWGGVTWQSPANDWGDQPGGFDLRGADALEFWARGARGGEKVKFGYGILGRDKTYHDTAKAEAEHTLTTEWTKYTFDLDGQDLSTIKTGFYWVLAGQGRPVTFFLDDIRYVVDAPSAPAPVITPPVVEAEAAEPE